MTVGWTFARGSCAGAAVEQVRDRHRGRAAPAEHLRLPQRSGDVHRLLPRHVQRHRPGAGRDRAAPPRRPGPDGEIDPSGRRRRAWTVDPPAGLRPQRGVLPQLDGRPGHRRPDQIPGCGAGQRHRPGRHLRRYPERWAATGASRAWTATWSSPRTSPQGQHTVQLVAFNSQENVTAFAQSDAAPDQLRDRRQGATQTSPLHWNVGGLQVAWAPYASMSDYNSDTRQSCAARPASRIWY